VYIVLRLSGVVILFVDFLTCHFVINSGSRYNSVYNKALILCARARQAVSLH